MEELKLTNTFFNTSKYSELLGVVYNVNQANLKQNPQLLSILAYSKIPDKQTKHNP